MAERLYSMRFDFIQCRTLPNTIATVLFGSLVERTVYSLDIYTHIDKVIEESHTNLRAFFRTLCIFVCVREMSCCFFYALHNTLWITEQHAIETRGLISISQAFWIEIPTKKKGDCRFVSAGYYGSFEQGELKWRLYREYRIRFQAIFKMQVLEKKLGKNYAFLPLSCVKPVIYLDGIEWIVECRRALEILINSWIYLVSWTLSPSRNSRDSKFHAINLTFPNH